LQDADAGLGAIALFALVWLAVQQCSVENDLTHIHDDLQAIHHDLSGAKPAASAE